MNKTISVISFIILFSLIFNISTYAAASEISDSNTLIYFDPETGQLQRMPANYYIQGTAYSSPYEGNILEIQSAYSEISAQIHEQEVSASQISPNSIIGSDGRTAVPAAITSPYCRICFLEIIWSDGAISYGTGWLYAPDRVATAGHCVYSHEHMGWASLIIIQPGKYNDIAPFGETAASYDHLASSTGWVEDKDDAYDYGLIRLNNKPLGNTCGYFGYSANSAYIGTNVTISGYPGDKSSSNYQYWRQWEMSGKITLSTSHRLYYLIDTYDGQSGAPIFKDNNIVVGIHTKGNALTNSGKKIDTALFNHMQRF